MRRTGAVVFRKSDVRGVGCCGGPDGPPRRVDVRAEGAGGVDDATKNNISKIGKWTQGRRTERIASRGARGTLGP